MLPGGTIDFWFSIGSTYTYLTASRLDEVARQEGLSFRWRPFNVQVIMKEQRNYPFSNKPIKEAYMWRDIERRAARHGLPVRVPAPYPLADVELANRVAVLAAREGWCPSYVQATYRRWFVEGEEAGAEPNLSRCLREIGQEPGRVVAAARSAELGAALAAATDEARRLNVFGSPSFVIGGEVFWGDDRLDDAVRWIRLGPAAVNRPG